MWRRHRRRLNERPRSEPASEPRSLDGPRSREEESVDDARRGMAVIELAEGRHELAIALRVLSANGIDVAQRIDDLVGRAQQRTGRLRGEVEVEATNLVPVGVEVVGEEEHRPAGVCEVE